jgi:hypothetical protein
MRRFIRSLIAFVTVVSAYGLYALAVVPFIEPTAGPKREQVVSAEELQAAQDSVMLQRKDLRRWFKDGDWELTSPKILETAQGKLLMVTYVNQPDGTVLLEPCTVVLTPQGQFASEDERDRRAIVLRAPSARLRFDSAVDLRRGKFGKLLGGLLQGKVTIQSGQKAPGPEDDLWVETKDVQLIDDRIITPHPVEFRMGANHGHGVDLAIQLNPVDEKATSSKMPNLGSVKTLELHRDVQVHLEMEGGGIIPVEEVASAGSPTVPVPGLMVPGLSAQEGPQPPVEITCQGMFRFDFENHVARFHDAVDVLRRNPVGPSDQLNCEVLALHFAPAEGTQVVPGKMPRLEPVWLEAHGNPVVIRSPRSGVHARGQVLKYHLKTRRVSLSSPREVIVQRPTDEIRTRELHYEMGNGKQLGQLYAVGPGWARGVVPEQAAGSVPGGSNAAQEPKRFEARWAKELRFRPHEQNFVLSLLGDAHVSQPGMGGLDGQEIHVWLVEEPVPGAGEKAKTRMFPDRILAQHQVRMSSQPMTGEVDTLQVWIRRPGVAPPTAAQTTRYDNRVQRAVWQGAEERSRTVLLTQYQPQVQPIERTARAVPPTMATLPNALRLPHASSQPSAPVATQPVVPEPLPEPTASGSPKYQLVAKTLRVELIAHPNQIELTRAVAQEHVRFQELASSAPGEESLVVTGDMLELEQRASTQPVATKAAPAPMVVHVTGQPAQVDARGMTLVGGTIHADQLGNRLWIDGPGRMSLPVNGELGGVTPAAGAPRKLEVSWKGDMNFDGQLAQFHQGVFSQLDHQVLETGALDVVLAQRINFARSAGAGPASSKPEVERLLCHDGVLLTRETYEGNQRTARERLRVSEMAIHQRTGAIQGQGPGWIRTVRQGSGDALPIKLPGGVAAPAAAADTAYEPNELSYVGVDFQQEVTGNLHQRELTFHEQIKLVYAPADDWDTSIDPYADPRELGPKAMRMESDELQVVQMAQQGAPSAMELTALGNVVVEGAMFNARADRAAFAEAKDRLLLEGSGRTHATLSRQELVGGPASTVTAGKFSYWVSTGKWRIDEGQSIDPGVLPPK